MLQKWSRLRRKRSPNPYKILKLRGGNLKEKVKIKKKDVSDFESDIELEPRKSKVKNGPESDSESEPKKKNNGKRKGGTKKT